MFIFESGTLLTELPELMEDYNKYLVTSWGHDPGNRMPLQHQSYSTKLIYLKITHHSELSGVIPGSNALFTLNDALCHSAILVQVLKFFSTPNDFLFLSFTKFSFS